MISMQELYKQARPLWRTLYPIYFDSTKSLSQGRRVSKELAISNPTVEQISKAVGMCKIKNIIEPHKAYSRDFLQRGRLKTQVFDKTGKPMNPDIKTKKQFILAVANNLKTIRANSQPNKK